MSLPGSFWDSKIHIITGVNGTGKSEYINNISTELAKNDKKILVINSTTKRKIYPYSHNNLTVVSSLSFADSDSFYKSLRKLSYIDYQDPFIEKNERRDGVLKNLGFDTNVSIALSFAAKNEGQIKKLDVDKFNEAFEELRKTIFSKESVDLLINDSMQHISRFLSQDDEINDIYNEFVSISNNIASFNLYYNQILMMFKPGYANRNIKDNRTLTSTIAQVLFEYLLTVIKNDSNHFDMRIKYNLIKFEYVFKKDNTLVPYSKLSSGEAYKIGRFILLEKYIKKNKHEVVVFDEPENSLHLKWQNDFIYELDEILEGEMPYILIATHSPFIILNYHTESLKAKYGLKVYFMGQDRKPVDVDKKYKSIDEALFYIFGYIAPYSNFIPSKIIDTINKFSLGNIDSMTAKLIFQEILDRLDDERAESAINEALKFIEANMGPDAKKNKK